MSFISRSKFLVIVILLVTVLSVSFLMVVISPHSCFSIQSSSRCLQCWKVLFLPLFLILIVCQRCLWDLVPYAWSLVSLFFGPFAYVLLWSTLIKGPEYRTRCTAQVFIHLIRFLQDSFASSSYLVLRYSFLILSFISTCLMVSSSKITKYL